MKKLVIFGIFVLLSMIGYGQATPFNGVRVANATTVFGVNIAQGVQIWDIGAQKLWQCTAATASTLTLTTGSANFIQIGGTGLGGTVTSVTGNLMNVTNGTTTPKLLPTVGIAKDSLVKMDSLATAGQYAKFGSKGLVGRSAASMASELGVKVAVVQDWEQAADSIASNRCILQLNHTPVTGTIAVQVNGVNLKSGQWSIVETNKLRIAFAVYKYDGISASYSY